MLNRLISLTIFAFPFFLCLQSVAQKNPVTANKIISIVYSAHSSSRIKFGATRLAQSLRQVGYRIEILEQDSSAVGHRSIVLRKFTDKAIAAARDQVGELSAEGFNISSDKNQNITVWGADNSGVLYGCLE